MEVKAKSEMWKENDMKRAIRKIETVGKEGKLLIEKNLGGKLRLQYRQFNQTQKKRLFGILRGS